MTVLNAVIAFVVGTALAGVLTFVTVQVGSPGAHQPPQSNILLYGDSKAFQSQ